MKYDLGDDPKLVYCRILHFRYIRLSYANSMRRCQIRLLWRLYFLLMKYHLCDVTYLKMIFAFTLVYRMDSLLAGISTTRARHTDLHTMAEPVAFTPIRVEQSRHYNKYHSHLQYEAQRGEQKDVHLVGGIDPCRPHGLAGRSRPLSPAGRRTAAGAGAVAATGAGAADGRLLEQLATVGGRVLLDVGRRHYCCLVGSSQRNRPHGVRHWQRL